MNKTKTVPNKINDCGISIVLQRQRHSYMKINNSGNKMIEAGNTASRGLLVQLVILVAVSPSSSGDLVAEYKLSLSLYCDAVLSWTHHYNISFLQPAQLWIKNFPSSLPRSEILRHLSILDHHWTGLKYKILQIHHRLHQFLFSVIFWWIRTCHGWCELDCWI